MEEEKTDQSVSFTITFWVQHINCTLSGILLMNMLLQICKDHAQSSSSASCWVGIALARSIELLCYCSQNN